MAELINKQDSLNQGREKINASILASERAERNANEALAQSENTQTQLDTIVINGDSSVEAAQARVDENGHAYSTLKDRLDTENVETLNKIGDLSELMTDEKSSLVGAVNDNTTQLAQKATKKEVQSNLNLKRDKSVPIGLNDINAELLAAIQGGEGTSFNLLSIPRDGSVTPKRTTFISVSTNLFNKNTVAFNTGVNLSGEEYEINNISLSDFIEVEPNTTYTLSEVSASYSVVYYNENKQFMSRPNRTGTFTTPDYAHFVRLMFRTNDINFVQLNKGDTLLPYEEYYTKLNDDIAVDIGVNNIDFIKKSTNLYNKSTTQKNRFVDNEGNILESTQNALSDFIRVEPGKTYTLNNAHTTVYYNENKQFMSRPNNTGTFTTPDYASFVRLVMLNDNVDTVQLNEGDTLLPYEDYYVWFDEDVLIPPNKVNGSDDKPVSEEKTYYFVPEEITGFYRAPIKEYIKHNNSNDYYNDLNQLAVEHPEYISSIFMGNDQSGTYPIYQYRLKPKKVEATFFEKSLPKIIITCGLHGEEVSSIYSMYHMIKLLCENWQDDPLLEYLRWNVEIVTIPIVNPYGFNHPDTSTYGGRHNSNGVDLNRNFSERWNLGGGSDIPGSQTYRGSAPFSEVESQYVKSMIDNNTDALFFGDYHTNGSSGDEYGTLIWHSLISRDYYSENAAVASSYYIGKLTREFIKEYDLPSDEGHFGFINRSYSGGLSKMYGASVGVDSCTIECFRKFPVESEYVSDTNVKACTEYIINWLLTLLNQFKSVY